MSKRKDMDISQLVKEGYETTTENCTNNKVIVFLKGPKDSLYYGKKWKILVEFNDNYPFKSPSVGFINKIYHPNIDFVSGSICLDVLNQEWTPVYNLVVIFETLLPQLLLYPNPEDPLNIEASNMMNRNIDDYNNHVKEWVNKYGLEV